VVISTIHFIELYMAIQLIQYNRIKLNDHRFCQKIYEIRLKQSENIPWIMKKEPLKFALAVFGFFALIEIAYLINHHFRFGS
jgi:hypothetical protein